MNCYFLIFCLGALICELLCCYILYFLNIDAHISVLLNQIDGWETLTEIYKKPWRDCQPEISS